MATMKDVAERAGVSIAAVSFVVNSSKRVAPATKERIEIAMRELGFRRNVVARGLASGRTRIIALLFPALDHRLGGTALQFVTGGAAAASARGYNLVMWPIGNDGEEIEELIAGGLADGVVLMEIQLDDARVDKLIESGIPFTLIGRTRDTAGLSHVDMDFERTVNYGIDYLMELGHRNISLVVEDLSLTTMAGYGPVVRTEQAYRERMEREQLRQVVINCQESPLGGRAAAAEVVAVAPETTALLVMNEDAAFGMVSGLRQAGLNVPRDMSLLSIATTPEMGAMSDPVLTTMNAPASELGKLGVNGLIDQLEHLATEPLAVLLPCELQLGESTAAPRS